MTDHTIETHGAALHGFFDRGLAPVLTVEPGESVLVHTLDCWWSAGQYTGGTPDERERVPEWRAEFGHALSGPIAVRGAAPGSTLAVRLDAVTPGAWGTTVAGGWSTVFTERYGIVDEHATLSWDLDGATGRNQLGHTVELRPSWASSVSRRPSRDSTRPFRRDARVGISTARSSSRAARSICRWPWTARC